MLDVNLLNLLLLINYRDTTDTPLPTPTHRYNAWADDRKSLGITPRPSGSGKGGVKDDEVGGVNFKSDREREEWEEEQKVKVHFSLYILERYVCLYVYLQKLDRAWYDFDGGYDDRNNPFADIPEEYTKKKEEQMAKHAVKRMSAQQRQINKVCHCLYCSPSLSIFVALSLLLSIIFFVYTT